MSRSASSLARRGLLVLWLVGVWLLLWGVWRADVVLLGVVVAATVVGASRLPSLPLRTRTRWSRVPGFVLRFAVGIVQSSWHVAVATVRTRQQTRSSVFRVHLPAGAPDTAVVLACNRISLEPGSIVIDIDRPRHRLYVYQLDTPDASAAEEARRQVQRVLDDVMATFPPRDPATRQQELDDDGRHDA